MPNNKKYSIKSYVNVQMSLRFDWVENLDLICILEKKNMAMITDSVKHLPNQDLNFIF